MIKHRVEFLRDLAAMIAERILRDETARRVRLLPPEERARKVERITLRGAARDRL